MTELEKYAKCSTKVENKSLRKMYFRAKIFCVEFMMPTFLLSVTLPLVGGSVSALLGFSLFVGISLSFAFIILCLLLYAICTFKKWKRNHVSNLYYSLVNYRESQMGKDFFIVQDSYLKARTAELLDLVDTQREKTKRTLKELETYSNLIEIALIQKVSIPLEKQLEALEAKRQAILDLKEINENKMSSCFSQWNITEGFSRIIRSYNLIAENTKFLEETTEKFRQLKVESLALNQTITELKSEVLTLETSAPEIQNLYGI